MTRLTGLAIFLLLSIDAAHGVVAPLQTEASCAGDTMAPAVVVTEGSTPQAARPPIQPVEPARWSREDHNKLVAFISNRYSRPRSLVDRIVMETRNQAARRQLDPMTVLALIGVESGFNPKAVSSHGALGLAQVLPGAHPEKIKPLYRAGKSPTDIRENIKMGVDILAEYRKRHNGDMRLALLRYNGSVKDRKGRYAKKVIAMQAALENSYAQAPSTPKPAQKNEILP